MNDPLMRLGQLAAEQEPPEEEVQRRLQRVRSRLQDRIAEPRPALWPRLRGFVALGAVTGLAVVGYVSWPNQERALEVHTEAQSGDLTGETVKSGEGTKQVQFSDGSRLSLHPQTVLRVAKTTPRGATLQLQNGRAFASIVPEEEAEWLLEAGPYAVRVTGTEFDLSWNAEKGELELAMHRGSVVLTGPNVPGQLKVQGSEFVHFAVSAKAEVKDPGQAADEQQAAEQAPGEEDEQTAEGQTAEEQTAEEQTAEEQTAEEQTAEEGSTEVQPAKERAASGRSAEELWSVVREARRRRDGKTAKEALLELRNRHGAYGQTAYLLGRVHADELGSTSEAIHWFEMYLREMPGGSLSEQAMGRLIELQTGTSAGRTAAQRYLDVYPEGSYAGLARSSLR